MQLYAGIDLHRNKLVLTICCVSVCIRHGTPYLLSSQSPSGRIRGEWMGSCRARDGATLLELATEKD